MSEPLSYRQYEGDGATVTFSVAFPYLSKAHIQVTVDGVATAFTWVGDTQVQLPSAPAAASVIEVRRVTPKSAMLTTFTDGSVQTAGDLNAAETQLLFITQEAFDASDTSVNLSSDGTMDAKGHRIANVVDPVEPTDAVNREWAETAMTAQLAQAITARTVSEGARDAAQASQSAAASSATTAATKAGDAAASATSAAASATSANTSATNASSSAAAAFTSAENAAGDASAAATSATNASSARAAAETARDTAVTKAGAASASATAAETARDAAQGYASTASTKAGEASAAKTAAETARDAAQGYASTASTIAASAGAAAGTSAANAVLAGKADLIGAAFTGNVSVITGSATFTLQSTTGGAAAFVDGTINNKARTVYRKGGSNRWGVGAGNATETGAGNAGSDFVVERYSDAGTLLDVPITVSRSTGRIDFAGVARPTFNGAPIDSAINVKDFGAKLDGSDDSVAFAAARAACPANGRVVVPPGLINTTMATDTAKTVTWQLAGNTYAGGSPVFGIGTDVVDTMVSGQGSYKSRGSTAVGTGAVQTIRQDITETGYAGTLTGVRPTLAVTTGIKPGATPSAYTYSLLATVSDNSSNLSGNSVGIYGQAVRQSGSTHLWAQALEIRDETNSSSAGKGALIGSEVLMLANAADPSNNRIIQDLVIGRQNAAGEDAVATYGTRITGFLGDVTHSRVDYGFGVVSAVGIAAFDASKAVFNTGGAPIAYRVGSDKKIDFSNDGTRLLFFNSGGALQYTVAGGLRWQIDDAGLLTAFGGVNTTDVACTSIHMGDLTAPTSSADPVGTVGEVRFAGATMYRKTASGWIKFVGATF